MQSNQDHKNGLLIVLSVVMILLALGLCKKNRDVSDLKARMAQEQVTTQMLREQFDRLTERYRELTLETKAVALESYQTGKILKQLTIR